MKHFSRKSAEDHPTHGIPGAAVSTLTSRAPVQTEGRHSAYTLLVNQALGKSIPAEDCPAAARETPTWRGLQMGHGALFWGWGLGGGRNVLWG